MQNRVLITGGAGCIGSDLAAELLRRGATVTVLDNLSSGKLAHIEALLADPGFRFIEGDVLDPAKLDRAIAGARMVWHLAANPDVKFAPGDATDKDLEQNTIATQRVLDAMRRHGVARIAFASTSAVYGVHERQPISEDAPTRPLSLYGASKLACEALAGAFHHLFGFQASIFRFANVVGPKVRKTGRTVIGDFIARLRDDPTRLRILGNGWQAKSYLLAEECVEGMLYASTHVPAGGLHIFNLGCQDNLPVNHIAAMVVEAMGLKGVRFEYTGGEGGWPGDVPRFVLDTTAINRLGWRARLTSEQAVRLAIEATLAARPAPEEALCR